jgi:uncharacterized protein (TIGR00375 family)
MKIFADLHLHSKYSRATSKNMDLEHLEEYAKIKGLNLLGTSDFTHPIWIKELKNKLEKINEGIFKTKSGMNFVLQTEISLMYTQKKGRRIHLVILAPNFEIVDQITEYLKSKGRIDYDGRPIFNIPSPELTENLMSISKEIEIIPAHIMTPWFGTLGSKSGFDSVKECFQEKTKFIHAIETGLSADPKMLWRISSLDKFSLISNSDSHSFWPWRIGRETNVFDLKELTYKNIISTIKEKNPNKFLFTIEVDPAFGKYHFDGHRNCNVSFSPKESKEHNSICPVCKQPLTIGVEYRVEELADREQGYKPQNAIPFKTLIPISEVIATVYNTQVSTKKVQNEYAKLIKNFNSEFKILLETPKSELLKITNSKIVDMLMLNRDGKLKVKPGYDGVYGKIINENEKLEETNLKQPEQRSISEF